MKTSTKKDSKILIYVVHPLYFWGLLTSYYSYILSLTSGKIRYNKKSLFTVKLERGRLTVTFRQK